MQEFFLFGSLEGKGKVSYMEIWGMFVGVEDEKSRMNRKIALDCENVRKIRQNKVRSGWREEEKCEEENTKRRGGWGGGGNDEAYPQSTFVNIKAF